MLTNKTLFRSLTNHCTDSTQNKQKTTTSLGKNAVAVQCGHIGRSHQAHANPRVILPFKTEFIGRHIGFIQI